MTQTCEVCAKEFDTLHGLRIHVARTHKKTLKRQLHAGDPAAAAADKPVAAMADQIVALLDACGELMTQCAEGLDRVLEAGHGLRGRYIAASDRLRKAQIRIEALEGKGE